MGQGEQKRLDSFYDIDNLVTINISMDPVEWQALKDEQPASQNFDFIGERYQWHKTTSVTVSGTKFPSQSKNFPGVGIIKKSYAGSLDFDKPSFKLDFTPKINPKDKNSPKDTTNEDAVRELIGTENLTLNNCKQDDAYIRQPLGYALFRQALVPSFRCNFAKVIVNGETMGIFVNIEPFKKRFAEKNFGNDKGNLYEIELAEDLTTEMIDQKGRVAFKGFSDYSDSKDIRLAAVQIKSGKYAAAQKVIDMDAFMRFSAMELLLKHWDGYSLKRNNAYMYNDVPKPVPNPAIGDVKIKFVPSGIDQILQSSHQFVTTSNDRGVVLNAILEDATAKAKLFAQIKTFANTIFGATNLAALKPVIDKMEAMLKGAGVNTSTIGDVRTQLSGVRKGGFDMIGETMPLEIKSRL